MMVKLHKLHYCYIVHTTYKSLALLSLLNDSNTSVDYLKNKMSFTVLALRLVRRFVITLPATLKFRSGIMFAREIIGFSGVYQQRFLT